MVSETPSYPLTGALAQSRLEPPPNPYSSAPSSVMLIGASGTFAIASDVDVRVGRDPSACGVTLAEPRVSGIHATLRLESGRLFVRDEGSNNGTFVSGARVTPFVWSPVPSHARLMFGPVEFSVTGAS